MSQADIKELTPTLNDSKPVAAQLGLWDAVSIIVGIVIGSTIYKTPPVIFNNVSSAWMGLAAWALGGLLSLVGALVYAELATTYPREGGDYVYLSRAFGPWLGFFFGWAQLAVIRSGSIGMMAFVFADYASELWDLPRDSAVILAIVAVVLLSAVNLMGVTFGKGMQNVLTATKVLGLGAILVAGFLWSQPGGMSGSGPVQGPGFGLALILILLGYGGWNDAAFVAAELRERKNIARSLIIGTAAIAVIYLCVNVAYVMGLGFDGVRHSKAVAAEILSGPFGTRGNHAMCVLVIVSALGAINGMIFTGSRVYASLGAEHRVFAWLGRWHPRLGSPHWALLAQTLFTLLMIVMVGTETGRKLINATLTHVGRDPMNWETYHDGFDRLLAATAPVFWMFFLLTGISFFVLRFKDPELERPFLLTFPWYPLLPLIFCATCLYMLYSAIDYAKELSWAGLAGVLIAVPLFFLSPRVSVSRDVTEGPRETINP
jgi:amino acid transporter